MHFPMPISVFRVGGSVGPYTTPIFSADRVALAVVLRRAVTGLPARADVFTAGRDYSPSTPTLLFEPSDAVTNPSDLAAKQMSCPARMAFSMLGMTLSS